MAVRVAVGDPQKVRVQFPGVAAGSVNVTVYSHREGTTSGPFTATDEGSGEYSYTLTAAMVVAVDELLVQFVGIVSGTSYIRKEKVEVASAYYFTDIEGRTLGPIGSEFTDLEIQSQRMSVEDQIEANCDTSFVGRFVEERVSGRSDSFIRLTEVYVNDIVKVLEDDVDVTDDTELDGRFLWKSNGTWAQGQRNIVVQYEKGFQTFCPEDLRRKAIEATRYGLLRERRQGMAPQVVTIGTEVGTLRMAVAGLRQPFGLPEVDAVVMKWAIRVGVTVAGT